MSTTTTVSTMSPGDRDRLVRLLTGAVQSCADQMAAARMDQLRGQVDALQTHSDRQLDVAAQMASPVIATPGDISLPSDVHAALVLPADLDLLAGLPDAESTTAADPGVRDTIPAATDDVELGVAWRDHAALRHAVGNLGLRGRWSANGGRISDDGGDAFEFRWAPGGMARVVVSSPGEAQLFERVNRRYVEDALRRHGGTRRCQVETLRDGGLVVRRQGAGAAPAVHLPAARPGRLEVDFQGFRGRECQRVLGALSRATGVRVIRNDEHAEEAPRREHLRIGAQEE